MVALRPYVAALWVWQGEDRPSRHRVLPDGCVDILFAARSDKKTVSHALTVVGTMTRFLEVSLTGMPLLFGVRFRPAGAVPFLGCPASELTNSRLALDEVWGKDADRILARLTECVTVSETMDVLQSALLERLAETHRADVKMMYAARCIMDGSSSFSLDDLASDVGLGPRQFRRRFEAAVGIGPKRFGRVIRFQRLLQTVLEHGGSWEDLALEHGYFDQAHLIRDFKELTGLGPTRYMATR